MPLLLAQSRKILVAFTTIALLMFSVLMLTVEDHEDVSFGTKASVLHNTHGHGGEEVETSDHEVQASTETHNHGTF